MTTSLKLRKSYIAVSFTAILLVTMFILSTLAHAIDSNIVGRISPMSTQISPGGDHPWHNLILSDHGKVQSVLTGMYFNPGSEPRANKTFTIRVSDAACDMHGVPGHGLDETFLVLKIGSPGDPDYREINISGRQACNGWLDDREFTIRGGALNPNYGQSGLWGTQVRLEWVGGAATRNAIAAWNSGEGSRIRFRFDVGSGNRVGLIRTNEANRNETNNSIVHTSSTNSGYADMYLPFGLRCGEASRANEPVSVYDADNGTGAQERDLFFYVATVDTAGRLTPLQRGDYQIRDDRIRVEEDPTGSRRGVDRPLRDTWNGHPIFTPSNFDNVGGVTTVWIADMQPDVRYILVVKRMHAGQFIYMGMPGDAIYGSPDFTCPRATVIPHAGPDQTITLGERATFTNWAETRNTANTGTDSFRLQLADMGPRDIPAGADWNNIRQLNPNRDVPSDRGTFTFTPTAVGRYCRETQISAYPRYVNTPRGTTARQCITVEAPRDRNVTIRPVVQLTGGDEVEAGSETSFRTYAEIRGYPNYNNDEWGFTSTATKAPARQLLDRQNYPANTTQVGRPAAVRGACTNDPPGPTTCNRWRWTCPNTTQTWNQATAPQCPMNYRHVCERNGDGTRFNQVNTNPTHTCNNRWNCNGTTIYNDSRPTCNWWQCQYGASAVKNSDIFGQPYGPTSWPSSGAAQPFRSTSDPGNSMCQARCNGGTGDLAGQATPGAAIPDGRAYDRGDLNCYERPSFNITCNTRATVGVAVSPDPTTRTSTVNRETSGTTGQACVADFVARGEVIGDRVCVRMTPVRPGGWNPVSPEQRTGRTWGFRVVPPFDEQCKKVIGKPYVRVVGGDAANGRAAAATSGACTVNTGAQIRAWNKGNDASNPYAGSGASVAAFTYSAIDQFASGQFANPILGSPPKALTFANTAGVYGTGWGAAPPCVGLDTFTGTAGPIPTTVNGKVQHRFNNSVFISQNITYASNTWADLSQVPLYQLVVNGDIYISDAVTQLDGTFIATGNIYTCATGLGAPVVQTWGVCKRQLVVNGALIANQVIFARDCATLNRAQVGETTVYTGGNVDQHCSLSGTKASEVINFLPEQWIRSGVGRPSNKYDAITNMPPIL